MSKRIAIIIPVCNEEACIGAVISELKEAFPNEIISVGVNGTVDASGSIARAAGVRVGESEAKGYGYGCQAAIDQCPDADAFVFVAGDGANAPADIRQAMDLYAGGSHFVIGQRTSNISNWKSMGISRLLPNLLLGAWVSLLTKRWWSDLGPLRLIDAELFHRMELSEWTWGWTIESQVKACLFKAEIARFDAVEGPRIAGEQKVSSVSLKHSLSIGLAIARAGWKAVRQPEFEESESPLTTLRKAEKVE